MGRLREHPRRVWHCPFFLTEDGLVTDAQVRRLREKRMAGKDVGGGRRGGGDERAGGAQGDEAEVLSTLLAERYERRSVMVTSNLVPPVTGPLRNGVE